MRIVDSHVHYWQPSLPGRPWDPQGVDLGPPWPVEQLLDEVRRAGIDQIVQVTPTVNGTDNRYALEGAERFPEQVAGVFGRFDPVAPGVAERLSAFASHPKMLGVRLTLMRPEHRAWFTDGTLDAFIDAASEQHVPVAIYAAGAAPALGALGRRHPDAILLVDHMTLRHSDPAPFEKWAELLALRAVPNLHVKVSYFPEVAHEPFPFPSVHRYAREVYETFGPDRLIWGSNFPPSQRACGLVESVRFFRELDFIPDGDKEKIFSGTFLDLIERSRAARGVPH